MYNDLDAMLEHIFTYVIIEAHRLALLVVIGACLDCSDNCKLIGLDPVLWLLSIWHDVQIKALQNLGLNVIRGVVTTEGPGLRRKKFLVTRSYVKHFTFTSPLL